MCCALLVHGWCVMYAGGWRLCSMHRVLLCMLEAVEGGHSLGEVLDVLEALEAMRSVLLCMLEAVEGRLCLLDELELPEVARCVLLCMLEAVEGGFHLVEVLEVMRSVLLC